MKFFVGNSRGQPSAFSNILDYTTRKILIVDAIYYIPTIPRTFSFMPFLFLLFLQKMQWQREKKSISMFHRVALYLNLLIVK